MRNYPRFFDPFHKTEYSYFIKPHESYKDLSRMTQHRHAVTSNVSTSPFLE